MFFDAGFSYKKLLSFCVVHGYIHVTKTRKKIVQIIRASTRIDEYRKKISESMLELTARKDNTQFCFAYVCKHFTKQIYLRSWKYGEKIKHLQLKSFLCLKASDNYHFHIRYQKGKHSTPSNGSCDPRTLKTFRKSLLCLYGLFKHGEKIWLSKIFAENRQLYTENIC